VDGPLTYGGRHSQRRKRPISLDGESARAPGSAVERFPAGKLSSSFAFQTDVLAQFSKEQDKRLASAESNVYPKQTAIT